MIRLTSAQKQLLDVLRQEGAEPACRIECNPQEWRPAQALLRKGLLDFVSEQGIGGYFEVHLAPVALGRTVQPAAQLISGDPV